MRVLPAIGFTVLLCLHATSAPSWATRVTNLTTGVLLFSDNYEGLGANVSHAAWEDTSGDYDPVANIGTWVVSNGGNEGGGRFDEASNPESYISDMQVTDFASGPDPGAFEGNNYFRLDRKGVADEGAEPPITGGAQAFGVFNTAQATLGDVIRLDTMFAGATDNNEETTITFVDDLGTTGMLPWFENDLASPVVSNRTSSGIVAITKIGGGSIEYVEGEWNRVIMDYAVGATTYDLTVINDTFGTQVATGLSMFNPAALPGNVAAVRAGGNTREGSGGTDIGAVYLDFAPNDPVPSVVLQLQVNPASGGMKLFNETGSPITMNYYRIASDGNSLDSAAWNSLDEQGLDSVGAGDGESWNESGGSDVDLLSEAFLLGDSTVADAGEISLGAGYNESIDAQDLVLEYGLTSVGTLNVGDVIYIVPGDMNNDGFVNAADVNPFVQALTNRAAYDANPFAIDADFVGDFNGNGILDLGDVSDFKAAVLAAGSAIGLSEAVPEPTALSLLVIATIGLLGMRRRQSNQSEH